MTYRLIADPAQTYETDRGWAVAWRYFRQKFGAGVLTFDIEYKRNDGKWQRM